MSTHEQRVAEIRERLEAATPGPWDGDEQGYENGLHWVTQYFTIGRAGEGDGFADVMNRGDADLIAHAPADLAYLLDRLERMERVAKDARAALESLPVDALGEATAPMTADDGQTDLIRWSIRDELIDHINRALDTPEPETRSVTP